MNKHQAKLAHARRRAYVLRELGGKCVECHEDNPELLQAHHIDPSTKEFNVTSGLPAWDRFVKEVEKCELVCKSCHKKRHGHRHGVASSKCAHPECVRAWRTYMREYMRNYGIR